MEIFLQQQSRMSTTHHLNITGKIKYRNLFLHVYAFWQHKSTKSGNSVLINKIMLRGTSLSWSEYFESQLQLRLGAVGGDGGILRRNPDSKLTCEAGHVWQTL